MSFYNPYAFVPAPSRRTSSGKVTGDGPPRPLGVLDEQCWSGRVRIRITATTPLLVTQQDGAEPTVRSTRTVAGSVALPPTSVKGMIRTEYEMVTNSRFGVFDAHDERLGHHIQEGQPKAVDLAPVRIVERNGEKFVQALWGEDIEEHEEVNRDPVLPAAWVPRYAGRDVVPAGVRHGDRVFAWLVLMRREAMTKGRWKPLFTYWRVVSMNPARHDAPVVDKRVEESETPKKKHVLLRPEAVEVAGFYVETGHNIANKHDERLFFSPELLEGGSAADETPLASETAAEWKRLLVNYRAANVGVELATPEWSRHLRTGATALDDLPHGTLCYATLEDNKIHRLQPVAMSRRLYDVAPRDLAEAAALIPATRHAELSPADRLFGWVPPEGRAGDRAGTRPLRGRVRLGAVETKAAQIRPVGKSLAVLGQPRPTQDLFYAAADDQGGPLRTSPGYQRGQGLRGRKVYPHQPGTTFGRGPSQSWLLHGSGQDVSTQSATLRDMVEEGAVFEADLHIENLTDAELGALLYVLRGPDGEAWRSRLHKLGGGKPLGFGSVTVEVIDVSDVRDGATWRSYFALDDATDATVAGRLQAIVDAAAAALGDRERLAYDRYLRGYPNDKDAEVHYPNDPQPARGAAVDENRYAWFVANRRGEQHRLGELGGAPLPDNPNPRR